MSDLRECLKRKITRRSFLLALTITASCFAVAQDQSISPPRPRSEKALQAQVLAESAAGLKHQLSPTPVPEVRVIYLIPSDAKRHQKFRLAAAGAIQNLQHWYGVQLAGLTFTLHTPIVETFRTSHPAEWYAKNQSGPDRTLWFWDNALADGFSKTGGKLDDPRFRWVFYINAAPDEDQVVGGTNGVALLPRNDVLGMLGLQPDPVCRWVGGLGHELGHAFGLDHPSGCDRGQVNEGSPQCLSLMYSGYATYCGTFLTPEHQTQLRESPFFSHQELKVRAWTCPN